MKLNIYKNQREIEKTYEADTYDILFGTVEDFIGLVDLKEGMTDTDLIKTFVMSLDKVKLLLKDIFVGVTDEELKKIKVKELLPIFKDVISLALSEMSGNGKN